MERLKILVIGSINMDLCLETDRIPVRGENRLYDMNYSYINGGKGANQSVAASKLGADTTFVGKVGDDASGNVLISALNDIGVNTEYMQKEKGANTGLAVIIIEADGQNRILVYPESNMKLSTQDIDKAMQNEYDAMLIQFEIPRDIVIYACNLAKTKNIPFIVDAGPAMDFPIEEIIGAEILSPNETETYAMSKVMVEDIHTAEEASKILFERSKAKYIVIKSGENGAYLYDGNTAKHFPAYKVTAVDPTAAGDAFSAALALRYLEYNDIEAAIKYAHAVGAIAVTRIGAQPSMPTLIEVEEFIANEIGK